MIKKRKAHLIMLKRKSALDELYSYAKDGAAIAHNGNLELYVCSIQEGKYICTGNDIDNYIVFNKDIFDKSYKRSNKENKKNENINKKKNSITA